MNKKTLFILLCSSLYIDTVFDFADQQAFVAYTNADMQQAKLRYEDLLVNDHNNSSHNYNMGSVLYKLQQYEDAKNCFQRSIDYNQNKQLLEQAYFNLANSYVQLQSYQNAITSYEKVLAINSDNERAKHNLEYVKDLLKEKQQKEQEQSENSQQQSNDQKSTDNNSSQQEQNSSNQQENENENGSQKDQSEQNEKNSDQQGKKDSNDSKNQSKNQGNKEDDLNQQQDQQDQTKDAEHSKENNSKQSSSGQSEKEEGKDPAGNNSKKEAGSDVATGNDLANDLEKSALDKKEEELANQQADESKQQSCLPGQKEQVSLEDAYAEKVNHKVEDDDRLDKKDKRILELLNQQEEYVHKKLLQMNVSKQGVTQYGQKNW